MIRKLTLASALLLTLVATAASAEEMQDCTDVAEADWLSEQDATAKAAGLGYDVRDFKVEGSCYEIYAMKDDARVEVVMNPATGEIVGNEAGEE